MRTKVSKCLVLLAVCGLFSGCAVVGPVLSLGSAALTGPLQYAGTAYSVCEYTYEFAVNDRDPFEVLDDKLDGLADVFDGDEDVMLAETMEMEDEAVVLAEADISVDQRRKEVLERLERRRIDLRRLEERQMAFAQARAEGFGLAQEPSLAVSSATMVREGDLRLDR